MRNACGVCATHSRSRSSVCLASAPSTSLTVSRTGSPAEAAPASAAAWITAVTTSGGTRGLAPSCTTATGASPRWGSPANTESCRCAPPGTTAVTLRTPCCISSMRARSTSEAPTTTTMRPTSGDNATRRAACRSMGTPATATNALGMVAPRRSPRPAATITAAAWGGDIIADPRERPELPWAVQRSSGRQPSAGRWSPPRRRFPRCTSSLPQRPPWSRRRDSPRPDRPPCRP